MHGGGWSRGSKDMLGPAATALAEQGFVVLAQEYRLTGEAPFPANIHDVKRAIRWAKQHAAELRLRCRTSSAWRATRPARTWCCWRPARRTMRGSRRPRAWAASRRTWRRSAPIYPPTLFHYDGARPSGALAARVLPGADASARGRRRWPAR